MRVDLYIPKRFEAEYISLRKTVGDRLSQVIGLLVKNFNERNIQLHIPTIRKILQNNPKELKKLRELLDEFKA